MWCWLGCHRWQFAWLEFGPWGWTPLERCGRCGVGRSQKDLFRNLRLNKQETLDLAKKREQQLNTAGITNDMARAGDLK